MSKPRVLLVEDDDIIREVYALKFELEGFPVMAAEHGAAALELLKQFKPDIILLDLMMPVMGGLEFLEALKGMIPPQDYPAIIVFSNISEPGEIETAMKLGVGAYWVKSDYTPERVTAELANWWASQSQR
ncbi:MAG TPA: response regulator [Candidatus Saccharimonadia bacterium]